MASTATSHPFSQQINHESTNKYGILGLIPDIALLAGVGEGGKFIE